MKKNKLGKWFLFGVLLVLGVAAAAMFFNNYSQTKEERKVTPTEGSKLEEDKSSQHEDLITVVPTPPSVSNIDTVPTPTVKPNSPAPTTDVAPTNTLQETLTTAPTITPALEPKQILTPTPTSTPIPTPTSTPTSTPTPTATPMPTATPTPQIVSYYDTDLKREIEINVPVVDGEDIIAVEQIGTIFWKVTNIDGSVWYIGDQNTLPTPTPMPTPNPEKPRKVTSVKAGKDAVIEMWDNGYVYVKGTGAVREFPGFEAYEAITAQLGEKYKLSFDITHIVIEEGITELNEACMFPYKSGSSGDLSLQHIEFPSTLKKLFNAFGMLPANCSFTYYDDGEKCYANSLDEVMDWLKKMGE